MALCMEVAAQLGTSYSMWKRFVIWDDITAVNASFLSCALVAVAIGIPVRRYLPAWSERLRAAPRRPSGDEDPRPA